MDVHITELRTELGRVRTVLEECEADRKTAEDKCRHLTDELKSQKVSNDFIHYFIQMGNANSKVIAHQSELDVNLRGNLRCRALPFLFLIVMPRCLCGAFVNGDVQLNVGGC